MEPTLIGLLAFSGVIIAALIPASWRGRNSHAKNNPGPDHTVQLTTIADRLGEMVDRLTAIEQTNNHTIQRLVAIETILGQQSARSAADSIP